jgi:predicted RNase H-related nuclease YkuK (DUF458 family)
MTWRDLAWHSAAGAHVSNDEITQIIRDHVKVGGRIFIGCDSNVVGTCCTYATAIVLYNENERRGGRYFFNRNRTQIALRSSLRARLMAEADMSIMLGLELQEEFPDARIEIHLDVSQRKENMSNGVADQVAGYAKAAGFECKLKPESWASSCVADEHTR